MTEHPLLSGVPLKTRWPLVKFLANYIWLCDFSNWVFIFWIFLCLSIFCLFSLPEPIQSSCKIVRFHMAQVISEPTPGCSLGSATIDSWGTFSIRRQNCTFLEHIKICEIKLEISSSHELKTWFYFLNQICRISNIVLSSWTLQRGLYWIYF